jgi:DNA topoisomerase-1
MSTTTKAARSHGRQDPGGRSRLHGHAAAERRKVVYDELFYVDDNAPGITRRRSGTGFAYRDPRGRLIRDADTLRRLRALAVPPAYTDVWICPDPNGHIQATGRDERGRKQYRYHPRWRDMAEETKYEHMLEFAASLSNLRRRVATDMALSGMPRRKVVATIVNLLGKTLIRVGNDEYAKDNKSYGLTTLRNRHVRIDGNELRFNFTGKGGKPWRISVGDRRAARIVRACQELPGQHLFQYLDEEGHSQAVTSSDVNAYLREITGRDITAKDFRTWAGTVLAALALSEIEAFDSMAAAKRSLRRAVEKVATRLGNTPTICRKCYVHPEVFTAYLDGELVVNVQRGISDELRDGLEGLSPEEAAVLAFLQERLARKPGAALKAPAAAHS